MAKRDYGTASFANEMKKTLEKAEAKGNSVTAINIRLDKIDENPDNNQIFNMDDIERLANTIKQDGFSGAIEVFLKDDGRYEISAGHRRCRAVALLGWETIPAIVSQADDEIKKRKKLVKSNINNRNMKPMDWARAFAYHKDTLCMEDAKASGRVFVPGQPYNSSKALLLWDRMEEDFGYKRRFMQKYIKLLSLIPELQEMIDNGILPVMVTSVLGGEPEELQRDFLKMVREQISLLSVGEEDNTSLPASSVTNIIKSVTAKQGRKESKEKRNDIHVERVEEDKTEKNIEPETKNFSSDSLPKGKNNNSQQEALSFTPISSVAFMENVEVQKESIDSLPVKSTPIPSEDESVSAELGDVLSSWEDDVPDHTRKENYSLPPVERKPDIEYADADIIRISNELVLIANKDSEFKDKDRIMQSINQMEEMIRVIKTRIE